LDIADEGFGITGQILLETLYRHKSKVSLSADLTIKI